MTDKIDIKREEAAIEELLRAWREAIDSKQADKAESFLTGDILEYSLAPPLQYSGRDPKGLQQWFDSWQGPIGSEARHTRLIAGPEVAFWSGLMHMTGTKTDGVSVDLWYRQTVGLVRTAHGWRIAHVHASVPFAMDGSGRAELALKP